MGNLTDFIGGQHYENATTGMNNMALEFWVGTQAQYNALATTAVPAGPGYNANTLYLITE